MGLFDSFLKKKSQAEEARLLVEEISWCITDAEVALKKKLESQQLLRFDKFWDMSGEVILQKLPECEFPEILQPVPEEEQPVDEAFNAEVMRQILEEVWLEGQGRCLRCQRDSGLEYRHTTRAQSKAEVRPPTSEELAALEDESDPLLEVIEDDSSSDKPAVAEAKKRRKRHRRERGRRSARRRLALDYDLVCTACNAAN